MIDSFALAAFFFVALLFITFKFMRRFIIGFLVLSTIIGVMRASHADEKRERDYYCMMVQEGHWPDYKQIYGSECQ